ncbi:hypothetical protein ABZ901_03110 [Actinacidiphila alni]|uniref:hypothetical protein n=1 Tax=Actinacidiphila alni TaxID=380248 RepID=UPI0033FE8EDE
MITTFRPDAAFTVVACAACRPAGGDPVLDRLRDAVRESARGLLVVSGCLDAVLRCRREEGLHIVVQPCDDDRAPLGPAVGLGPLTSTADADVVCAWLRAGAPHSDLPARFVVTLPGWTRNTRG